MRNTAKKEIKRIIKVPSANAEAGRLISQIKTTAESLKNKLEEQHIF